MADLLTVISLFVIFFTWLITHLRDNRVKKKEHTAEILSAFVTNESLAAANYQLTNCINKQAVIDMTTISEEMEFNVVTMLDRYEFICEMFFLSKIIDERTLLQLRGRLMCKTYFLCEKYIGQTRECQGRKVYESFEKFALMYNSKLFRIQQ